MVKPTIQLDPFDALDRRTWQEMRDIETEVNMISESLSEMRRRYWLGLSEEKEQG